MLSFDPKADASGRNSDEPISSPAAKGEGEATALNAMDRVFLLNLAFASLCASGLRLRLLLLVYGYVRR
jgi:hypothetical protein